MQNNCFNENISTLKLQKNSCGHMLQFMISFHMKTWHTLHFVSSANFRNI